MELKYFILPLMIPVPFSHGWGNGYVALPPTHPLFGKHYYDLSHIQVHGGLTFSGKAKELPMRPPDVPEDWWVLGFDTCHAFDTIDERPMESLEQETLQLKSQLQKLDTKLLS